MSELTPCNYCNLNRYRRQAAHEGKKIILLPAKFTDPEEASLGGTDVFMVPKDFKLGKIDKKEIKQYKISWMWEISDHCVC